jgi:3-phosphoshikimate 1-carboxyvinyltransferase
MSDDVYRVRRADGPVIADVRVPPSKSIVNRALICAALVDGTSEIIGVAPGDDTASMIDCLQQLGCGIGVRLDDGERIADVIGTGGALTPGPMTIHAGLAGTTSRFVTALAALGTGEYTIDGEPPLRGRPMAPLHNSLAALGATVTPGETPGRTAAPGGCGRDAG